MVSTKSAHDTQRPKQSDCHVLTPNKRNRILYKKGHGTNVVYFGGGCAGGAPPIHPVPAPEGSGGGALNSDACCG